ncbi:MAG: hypothetical protein IPM47_01485 [Sphingobacteriales bacterium]|nr:MAG: hypothetical protein IPM47_01485 [Sphingobacteriales bacterium]
MNLSALITMILAMGIVTTCTAYFFWKVLITPPKAEPDSYTDNDDEVR